MIGSKRVWTGITDENPNVIDNPYGNFKFLDGTRSSIKRYDDEDPSGEKDVFLKWGKNAPDNYGSKENRVEIFERTPSQYILNDLPHSLSNRHAFCEKLKADCLEGIYIFISYKFP